MKESSSWNRFRKKISKVFFLGLLFGCAHFLFGFEKVSFQYDSFSDEGVITASFIRARMMEFSGASPAFVDGKEVHLNNRGSVDGRRHSTLYLKREYEKLGLKTELLPYEILVGPISYRGTNVVAEIPGKEPNRVVVVSSHLDSVKNAGANDDASGTVVALSIAKAMAKLNPRYTIRFMAFDEEEKALIGSRAYLKSQAIDVLKDSIVAVLQMDMVGYSVSSTPIVHFSICSGYPISDFLEKYVLAAAEAVSNSVQVKKTCLPGSDHDSFLRAGIPSLLFVDESKFNGDPCYHKACDTYERLNFDYMKNVGEILMGTIREISGE